MFSWCLSFPQGKRFPNSCCFRKENIFLIFVFSVRKTFFLIFVFSVRTRFFLIFVCSVRTTFFLIFVFSVRTTFFLIFVFSVRTTCFLIFVCFVRTTFSSFLFFRQVNLISIHFSKSPTVCKVKVCRTKFIWINGWTWGIHLNTGVLFSSSSRAMPLNGWEIAVLCST